MSDKTRIPKEIRLLLKESEKIINLLPPPSRSGVEEEYRKAAIGFAKSAISRLSRKGDLQDVWYDAISSVQAAKITLMIRHFGRDPRDWTDFI